MNKEGTVVKQESAFFGEVVSQHLVFLNRNALDTNGFGALSEGYYLVGRSARGYMIKATRYTWLN